MPSKEALYHLSQGHSRWNAFRKSTSFAVCDLTLAEVSTLDLRGCDFTNCDLSGSTFDSCNLDATRFSDCTIARVTFEGCSHIDASFDRTTISNARFLRATFRSSRFELIEARDCTFRDSNFEACRFSNVRVAGLHIHQTAMVDCELRDVGISRVDSSAWQLRNIDGKTLHISDGELDGAHWHNCIARDSSLRMVRFTSSRVTSISLPDSELIDVSFQTCTINELDLTASRVVRIDLEQIDLTTAVLLECSLIDCRFPEQRGFVSKGGRYVPSKFLMTQPAQDVKGIDPHLRRMIADAQYLVSLERRSDTWAAKAGLRFWGLTSEFGQSVGRLALVSLLVILVHAIALIAIHSAESWSPAGALVKFHPEWMLDAAKASTYDFVGSSSELAWGGSDWIGGVRNSCRVFGYVMLGLWISLLANKLGKLSAQ